MTSQTEDLTAAWILRQQMPEGHQEIWEFFLQNMMRYPNGTYIPPFRRPTKPDKPKQIAVAEFETMESKVYGFPRAIRLHIRDGRGSSDIQMLGDDRDAERIASDLFSFRRRGSLTVFRYGNAKDFRILAQSYITGLLALGFSIQPINAGSELIGIRVGKSGHSWQLVDFEKATGIDPDDLSEINHCSNGAKPACYKCLEQALDALHTIQSFLIHTFGVSLRMTIGSASIRAASSHLPADVWKWRPHPLLVTMCRLGGGFRGGIITGRGYRGPAWMVDTNRLYTYCLTRQLPIRSALSHAVIDGILRAGVYVVSIIGPGSWPIYVPVWRGRARGFSVEYWRGDACYSVLTSAEIDSIRHLGYGIETGFGFRFLRTFNLAAYVGKILGIINDFGRDHTFTRITKPMGNSVYGKFAESPERSDSMFAINRPSRNYFPFVDSVGNEIPNLWERKYVRYNSHQHIDIAATITGYGRSHMYDGISAIRAAGGIIAATNTDSIITDIDPRGTLSIDASAIGKWRNVAYDHDGITVARNAWAVGGHIALAGAPSRSRAMIELIAKGQTVVMQGAKKGPLSPGGPIAQRYDFSYAASSNTLDLDASPSVAEPTSP